jgi:hypothetical protein
MLRLELTSLHLVSGAGYNARSPRWCRISGAARKANDRSGPGRNPPMRIRVSDIPRFELSDPDVISDDDKFKTRIVNPGISGPAFRSIADGIKSERYAADGFRPCGRLNPIGRGLGRFAGTVRRIEVAPAYLSHHALRLAAREAASPDWRFFQRALDDRSLPPEDVPEVLRSDE